MEDQSKPKPKEGEINSNRYVYRDWSHATPSQTDWDAIEREKVLHPDARKLPVKLNAILNNREFSSIIVWLPHGRSWRILDRDRLTKEVLPLFFQNANFNSFVRLVNAWGFRRIKSGVNNDSYYHELFLRGMPHLHIRMKRLLSHEKKAPIGSIDECPNFDAMSKLPEVESGSISSSLGSPRMEQHPIVANRRKQARKNRTYTSNVGEVFQRGKCSIHGNVSNKSSLFPFSQSSLDEKTDHDSNTASNINESTPTGAAELESILSSRKSLILAQYRLRQLHQDRIARLQSSIDYFQNHRMHKISASQIHTCGISGVLRGENSPNTFVSEQRSEYPHSLQHDGPGPSPGPGRGRGRGYATSLISKSSNAIMSQIQNLENYPYVPSQSASLPYMQLEINRGGDGGCSPLRIASPSGPSPISYSPHIHDRGTTPNGASLQYECLLEFHSCWRGPSYHGNDHDATSSSNASESNSQRRQWEKKSMATKSKSTSLKV